MMTSKLPRFALREVNFMKYKIKEVSEMTGVSTYTLRYYEKEGIIPPIGRDEAGRRYYTNDNLAWIELVTCLKETNMPVIEIKEIVRLSQIGDQTIDDRKVILQTHKARMLDQIKSLENGITKVDKKLDFYNGAGTC